MEVRASSISTYDVPKDYEANSDATDAAKAQDAPAQGAAADTHAGVPPDGTPAARSSFLPPPDPRITVQLRQPPAGHAQPDRVQPRQNNGRGAAGGQNGSGQDAAAQQHGAGSGTAQGQRNQTGIAKHAANEQTAVRAAAAKNQPSGAPSTPAAPPAENPAAQAGALNVIKQKLGSDGVFSRLSHDDAAAMAGQLSQLGGPDAGKVLDKLQQDGQLDQLAAKLTSSGGLLSSTGLTPAEQSSFLNGMAGKLDGAHLATLQRAWAKSGDAHSQDVAGAVAANASTQTKIDFIRDTAAQGAVQKPGEQRSPVNSTTSYASPDAKAAATVLASTRGKDAADAFGSLTPEQRQAVFIAAAGAESGHAYYSGDVSGSVDGKGFDGLMAAAASINDPNARASVVSDAAIALQTMGKISGMTESDLAPLANTALRTLDGPALEAMPPDQIASLAATVAKGQPAELAATAQHLSSLPASPARNAAIATLFLKTDGNAYQNQPALTSAMGAALASAQTSDPAKAASLGAACSQMLGTNEGRAFLADPNVNPESRMWALGQVAADPAGAARMIAGQDKPWESTAVAQAFARPAVERMAATRGNQATELGGGTDIDNFVGASMGAPITAKPKTEAEAAQNQADAAQGKFNYYSGTPAVEKAAKGIRDAQKDMGGGDIKDIKVSTLPVTFSSQEDGVFNLNLYKVEGPQNQSRYVDNTGRFYKDLDDWKKNNGLPPGKMTYPADGKLGEAGQTKLVTEDTPREQNKTWDRFTKGAALVGAVAGGALLFTGVGSPLGATLLGVSLTSAGIAGVQAASELRDRATHGETLSLSDPEARAAWFGLGGSALTVVGAGGIKLATSLVNAGRNGNAVAALARASGIANTGANLVDTAATANGAYDLARNWSQMTPAQRAEGGLQIAFWGAMRSVSTRTPGQKLDGYSFRQQMNHAMLETGAAVKLNPALGAHDVSIVREKGRIEVQHGANASKEVIDIHNATARDLVKAAGTDGAITRAITGKGFKPGSEGERVIVEAAKHETLLKHYDQALQNKNLSASERQSLQTQRASVEHDLTYFRSKRAEIEANPALGHEPAENGGVIDVKQKNTVWLNPDGTIQRSARANASWDSLQTGAKSAFPDAKPVQFGRGGLVLPDGTRVTNTSSSGHGINLDQFVKPLSEGGYGGRVFYDQKSGSMILAVNMASNKNPKLVDRVEVPYKLTKDGWSVDFSQYAPASTKIDSTLKADRELHFGKANKKLAEAWDKDSSIKERLGLSPEWVAAVERGVKKSPDPYTWHHVNNKGDMELVDSAIHGLFLHDGGIKDWGK